MIDNMKQLEKQITEELKNLRDKGYRGADVDIYYYRKEKHLLEIRRNIRRYLEIVNEEVSK
jgi:hypothetical protein